MLLLEVLQAEDELDGARLRYAQAVAHYNQSQIRLLASLGLLDVGTLAAAPTQPAAR
jgi:outer membrane protein TolC